MQRLRRMLMWLGGAAVFLTAFGYWQWHRLLDELQISELRADVEQLGFSRLQLGSLHFHVQVGERIWVVDLQQADVQWQWQGLAPYFTEVVLGELNLQANKHIVQEPTALNEESLGLPDSWQVPSYFPQLITIEHAVLALPCSRGRCPVVGRFNSLRVNDRLNALWVLEGAPAGTQVNLSYNLSRDLPQLSVVLHAPELLEAHLQMDLINAHQLLWSGDVSAQIYRPGAEWQPYFKAWNIRADLSWLEAIGEPMRAKARWQLDANRLLGLDGAQLSDTSPAGVLQSLRTHLDGSLVGEFHFPSRLPVVGIGELSGQARVDLAISNTAITRYDLELDIRVDAPEVPAALKQYELAWENVQFELHSQAATDVDLHALPLQLNFVAQGVPDTSFSANVLLNTEALSVTVENALLNASANRWSPISDVSIENLKLAQAFNAKWHGLEQRLDYHLTSPGEILLDLQTSDARIHNGQIILDELSLQGELADWQGGMLTAKGAINIAEFHHPSVNPKPWQWRGQVNAAAQKLQVNGLLVAGGQLNIEHQLSLTPEAMDLTWQLADVFLLAGTGLQEISPLWPPLLTLSRGRIGAQGQAHWSLVQPNPQFDAVIDLSGVTGLYDTTVFKGASAQINVSLKYDDITLSSDNLTMDEIVQGFTLTKMQGAASYQANSAHMVAGVLTLARLEGGLLGGQIRVPAGVMDLNHPKQSILIELQDLDLAQLLAEHPAGNLKGSGRISGRIPVEWSAAGVRVAQGTLAAQAPGGYLQYRSPGAAQMAAGSQNMKIITDALDDFHYTLLNSDVSYDESGKLLLGVRLEGKNPAVEAGRPINFNINLEEDLPALIYSLQLTNQLNDIIKKRVQEKMRKKAVP